MTAPFRENNRAARKLELINKICTYLVFITYPVYVLYLCFTAGHMLALSIIAPLVGFIAVSVFRYIVNRPRPYEKFDMPPVIPKDTHGRSFPSRHVFFCIYNCIYRFNMLTCCLAFMVHRHFACSPCSYHCLCPGDIRCALYQRCCRCFCFCSH